MGAIIGTCGHQVTMEDVEQGLIIKDLDGEGNKVIASICVCQPCRKWYKQHVLVLENKDE